MSPETASDPRPAVDRSLAAVVIIGLLLPGVSCLSPHIGPADAGTETTLSKASAGTEEPDTEASGDTDAETTAAPLCPRAKGSVWASSAAVGCANYTWGSTRDGTFEQPPDVVLTCPLTAVCATVVARASDDSVYDPEEAACIVEALRDGTPAHHRYRFEFDEGYSELKISVHADGIVTWLVEKVEALGPYYEVTWRTLPEPARFDECCVDTREGLEGCLHELLLQPCPKDALECP